MKKITLVVSIVLCLVKGEINAQSLAWAKQFDGPSGFEGGYEISIDAAGNLYTVGTFDSPTDFDFGPGTYILNSFAIFGTCFVDKHDASGNIIWAKVLAQGGVDNRAFGSTLDNNANVYSTGDFGSTCDFDPGAGSYNITSTGTSADMFISKLDSSGNFIWARSMGGASNDAGRHIKVDNNGNVYTTGYYLGAGDFDPGPATYTLSHAGSWDIFISKLNSSGNFVWAKGIGGNGLEECNDLIIDGNGNIYFTGYFNNTVDFNPGPGVFNLNSAGGEDAFILKLDSSGNFIWAKQIGGSGGESGVGITMDSNANIYLAGSFTGTPDFDPGAGTFNMTSAGSYDIFICVLDSSGNFMWAKQMGGAGSDGGGSIILNSGSICTLGSFNNTSDFDPGPGIFNLTSTGNNDIFISTLDMTGNFISAISMGGDSIEYATSMALANNGDIYLTGWIYDTADFDPGPNTFNLIPSGGSDAYIVKLAAIPTSAQKPEMLVNNVFVFPNPATSEIKIAASKIEHIEIFNTLGEKVYTIAGTSRNNVETINVSKLSSGIYLVKVFDGEKSYSKKLIVE